MVASVLTIDQLWARVNDPSLDALERVKASVELRASLRTLSHLLATEARANGHTWTEIGDALEITRQAAQQRFT